jgi:outer membrane protein assembly factor BamD
MIKFLISLSLLALFTACSSYKPKGRTEAEILFKEAQELMEAERYILATEKLNAIKTQHPYSFYATPAELMQADVLYLQESYVEAAAAYLLFRDFHPRHEKIAYVIFRIAESFYKQIPSTIDRDLEPALEAIKYYEEVVSKYPDSSYKKKAEKKISRAKSMLRQKDQYIADFYFKTENYAPARYWYLDILDHHQDKKTRNHAMLRTILATAQLKEWQPCLDYIEKFYQEVDKEAKEEIKSVKQNCKNKEI